MIRLDRTRRWLQQLGTALRPSDLAWRGATTALVLVAALVLAGAFANDVLQDFAIEKLAAFAVWIVALLAAGVLGLLVLALIQRLPRRFRWSLFLFAPLVVLILAPHDDWQGIAVPSVLLLLASLIGGSLGVLLRSGRPWKQQRMAVAALATGVAAFAVGLYAVFGDKEPANPLLDEYRLEDRTLSLDNPASPGRHEILTLTYGSGTDRHRPEYGARADLISRSVDGSKLIDNWDGISGWLRTRYWGFDATALPLQARVWYPAGSGSFPLVLIVHGNHAMEDFSDPGYGYLGELLASRGIILASVDENFLNYAFSAGVNLFDDRPGLKKENDARGWLLLEHLAQWRDWNADPGHPFHGRVDMDRVALIGHSRGGEAVAIAAAFNGLSRYPDDATLEFDYGFNLRGVIAIAPVDGQYQPREQGTPVDDVNYFTIHGSMDGDVQSFEGVAQYSRVRFRDPAKPRFKASLYVVGANHGQFNTTWERLDTDPLSAWALNLDGIMPAEAQRDIARVYFSAFLEIVLRDRSDYLPIFADARRAAAWLPDTFYISQFADSRQREIADFEEDIDPSTLSLEGGRIATRNLTKWHERRIELKWDPLLTHAALFAWDSRVHDDPARVDFELPPASPLAATGGRLILSLSEAGVESLPDDWEDEGTSAGSDAADGDDTPLDWTIVLRDAAGVEAKRSLSDDHALYPQVQAVPRRAAFLDANEPAEALFRRYEFAIDDFARTNADFDPGRLATISFVFDDSPRGAILLDDISFRPADDSERNCSGRCRDVMGHDAPQ
jgi:predicted dienelactone hydrolase